MEHRAYAPPLAGMVTQRGGTGNGDPAAEADARGRLHVVWHELAGGVYRLRYTRSDDRGATWTAPRFLAPTSSEVPADAQQYQPGLAVNKDGVVGVAWFDTRHQPGVTGYDRYFTASTDGGETFSAPVRVSTVSSTPRLDHRRDAKDHTKFRWLPGFDDRRWASGGDYVGMTALADGAFLPVWPDARHDGVQQIYGARIRVTR